MKIADKNPFINLEAYFESVKDQKRVNGSAKQASGRINGEDKVELSPKGKEIQEAKRLLESIPDVRNERITLIKKQIEKGTYQINGEKTAGKMLREMFLNELS